MNFLLSEEHLVEAYPDGVDIRLTVVLLALNDLGCHVEWGAKDGLGELLFGKQLRETEVRNFDLPVMQQNVCQFKVSVQNLVLDKRSEAMEDLHEELDCFILRELLLAFDVCRKIALIAVLQLKVKVIRCLLQVVESDDVTVVAALEHFNLVLQ